MDASQKQKAFERLHRGRDEPHLLREIVRTHQVFMAVFSRRVGMPSSRLAILRLLAVSDEDVGVMDLARRLGVNAAAVTRRVKEMESGGLIRRRSDPTDGRRSPVRLSPKGLRLFEALHERGHELERALSSVVSNDEMAHAATVLMKVRGVMEGLR